MHVGMCVRASFHIYVLVITLVHLEYLRIWIFLCIFLGAFEKATIGFIMYVCPHGTTRLPLDGF
jgi:hypothetical protein